MMLKVEVDAAAATAAADAAAAALLAEEESAKVRQCNLTNGVRIWHCRTHYA